VEILLRCDTIPREGFNVGSAILAPTRELAGQIYEILGTYLAAVQKEDAANGARLSQQLFVGGTEAKAAAKALQCTEVSSTLRIVVATPGRFRALLALAGKETLNLKPLEVLVFDEADRLLQLGFSMDLAAVLSAAPKQRRTGLFSATLTAELQQLMKTGMRNPVHVCVRLKRPAPGGDDGSAAGEARAAASSSGTAAAEEKPAAEAPSKAAAVSSTASAGVGPSHELPAKLQNFYVRLPAAQRLCFLRDFLESADVRRGKTIVFFLTCACVDYFHTVLRHLIDGSGAAQGTRKRKRRSAKAASASLETLKGGRVEKLHGQMEQTARSKAYEKFCRSASEGGAVLLATDLAARGIDVENVNWVVQFDAPLDPSAFVHRVGRTARAGVGGRSVAMLMPHEDSYVQFLGQRGIILQETTLAALKEQKHGSKGSGDGDSGVTLRRAKKLVETDRAVILKANKAFVSFVRAYQEHTLPFIFPFKSLDLGALATAFACCDCRG